MEFMKSVIVALTIIFSSNIAWAEEASGSCRIGSGYDYVEATAYLTEISTQKYSLDVVVANSAPNPLVNIYVTVTASKNNGETVKLFDGMVYPKPAIPGSSSGSLIKDKSINYNTTLSNLTVTVKNAVCK